MRKAAHTVLHMRYPLFSWSVVPACPLVNRQDTAARSKEFTFTFSLSNKSLYILCFVHLGQKGTAWQKQSLRWKWMHAHTHTHTQTHQWTRAHFTGVNVSVHRLKQGIRCCWMWGSWEYLCVSAVSSHSASKVRGRHRAFSLFQSLDMWGLFFTVPFKTSDSSSLVHNLTPAGGTATLLEKADPWSESCCGQSHAKISVSSPRPA